MPSPADLISLRAQWTEAVVRVAASLGLAIDYSLTFISLRPECQGRDGILPRALIIDAAFKPTKAEREDGHETGKTWRYAWLVADGAAVDGDAIVSKASEMLTAFMQGQG